MDELLENDLMHVLGQITALWSDVETELVVLVQHFANAIDPAFESDMSREILCYSFNRLDIRERIAVLKVMSHDVQMVSSLAFYESVSKLLNHIDGTLRPERNRFIHGYWLKLRSPDIIRDYNALRVIKPQAHKSEVQTFIRQRFPSVAVVRSFRDHLIDTLQDMELVGDFACSLYSQAENRPPKLPQPLPTEWRSLTRREWQDLDMQ